MQLCREALGLLRPDGGAFFVVCHNRRALSARAMGLKSPIFDVEHLQLFSPKSIRFALERAGFRWVDVRVLVNRYPLSYWLRLFPAGDLLDLPVGHPSKRAVVAGVTVELPVGLPMGDVFPERLEPSEVENVVGAVRRFLRGEGRKAGVWFVPEAAYVSFTRMTVPALNTLKTSMNPWILYRSTRKVLPRRRSSRFW